MKKIILLAITMLMVCAISGQSFVEREQISFESNIYEQEEFYNQIFNKKNSDGSYLLPKIGEPKIDSMIFEMWNDSINQLEKSSKNIVTYDSIGHILFSALYKWDNTIHQWVIYSKVENETNENGDFTSCNYYWKTDQWVGSRKSTKKYTEKGDIKQEIKYIWNNSMTDWMYSQKSDYVRDSLGNETELKTFNWDKTVNQWIPSYKFTKKYDENGNKIGSLDYEWRTKTSEWREIFKTTYKLDARGNPLEYISYSLDYDLNQLVASYKLDRDFLMQTVILHYLLLRYGIIPINYGSLL